MISYRRLFTLPFLFISIISWSFLAIPTHAQSVPPSGYGSPPTAPVAAPTTPTGYGSPPTSPTTPGASTGGLQNPLNNISSLQDLLTAILSAVVDLGSIFLIFMLVYVGFLFVAAQGNEEKIRSARAALIWTVIGGLILLGAKAISIVIQTTVTGL